MEIKQLRNTCKKCQSSQICCRLLKKMQLSVRITRNQKANTNYSISSISEQWMALKIVPFLAITYLQNFTQLIGLILLSPLHLQVLTEFSRLIKSYALKSKLLLGLVISPYLQQTNIIWLCYIKWLILNFSLTEQMGK